MARKRSACSTTSTRLPSSTGASGPKEEIAKVEFELTIGNDYQVWMTSNNQTNRSGEPVLLLVAQAEGNVQDNTNLRILKFEYGLPTGDPNYRSHLRAAGCRRLQLLR